MQYFLESRIIMTTTFRLRSKLGRSVEQLLLSGALVGLIGAVSLPAQAAVTVDQSPLIIQQPLPPNLVLMLDDSGSMDFGYMPDICYIDGTSGCVNKRATYATSVSNDALISATSNGVYYDPSITYSPPTKVDGTSYPDSPGLTTAWVDGFNPSESNKKDLTNYMEYNSDNGVNIPVSYSFTSALGNRYFWYTKGSNGSYTRYYVAASNCNSRTNCVLASDISGVAAPVGVAAGKNIANWFSYYHTRMLMTKSGLMNSFSKVDPSFRVGFGSINGNNKSGLPSDKSTYNSRVIAQVKPFGDGASGTQKANFWSWLAGEQPGGGTPLQSSLDAVGQYYQSAQPWQTSGSDSNELACRQSYTILTTDGFWNGAVSNAPGNVDGANGSAVTGPNGQSYTYTSVLPYKDTSSDTLADYAMKYWRTDLRSTVANEVPPSTEDPAFWQHMTTFTLGLGFVPLYADQVTPIPVASVFNWANGGSPISSFSWPAPKADSINNIADLAHAAINGHGGFYSAKSPQAFASGIADALGRAAERVGTGASLAANSTQLKTGTVAYQANYYTSKWKGDLKAFAIDSTTGAISTSPTWSAATALPTSTSRKIYTSTLQTSGKKTSRVAIAFANSNTSTPPALSTAQLAALGSTASEQAKMVSYLRGNATYEQKNTGGVYRNRDTPLGDIVDSQPIYVGAPDSNQFYTQSFTGTDTFAAYASDNEARASQILVAANDGMLHIFNGTTGVESYAYLPSAVILGGVKKLSEPTYGASTPHQYFNDGELTVADVYFNKGWHTVVVGTTGRGAAKAIYALDITDPAAPAFLWERSAGDGLDGTGNTSYIGQMTGKPVVAQTADGVWSVLMGNGYNSTKGVAALLQFSVETGALTVHATDSSADNGLAAPGIWIDSPSSGVGSTAYAGDRLGRVWSFTLNNGTTATPSSTGSLLFSAVDANQAAQPITSGMLVGKDPATSNVWVFFGTGQYLSNGDLANKSTQTWYGLVVQSADTTLVTKLSQGRGNLVERSILAETAGSTSPTVVAPARAVTAAPSASDMTGKSGWYMDLTSPLNGAEGERMVTPNQFQGSLLLGTTRIPIATDLCNPSGRGWIMAVNPFTGTNPSSSFFDINGDGTIGSGDTFTDADGNVYSAAGVGFSSLPNNPIFVGSTMLVSFDNGTTGSIKTSNTSGGIKRVSWRELINQ